MGNERNVLAVVRAGVAALLLGMSCALALPPAALAAGGPAISINDVSVTEGNSGSLNATFTISLDVPDPVNATTITYTTADNTAVAPSDYTAKSDIATIPANTTSVAVTVGVNGDTLNEANETFFVNLTGNPSGNATILDAQGIGTILNNDALPKLSIANAVVFEDTAGPAGMLFNLTLAAASGQPISVTYATSNGSAAAGLDYVAAAATVLSFAPGELSKQVAIPIIADQLDEDNETFNLNLTNPVNVSLNNTKGVGTINDDDLPPTISINSQSVLEGNSGSSTMAFSVSLSALSGKSVTVKYQTADSTATAPADYTAISLRTLTFAAGVQVLNVNVVVRGDTIAEGDETFAINLSAPTNATLGNTQGIGTIVDNDQLPTLSINDVTIAEPASGLTNAVFALALSSASGLPVSVNYATGDGSATAGLDYSAQAGTVQIPAGATAAQISIPIQSDSLTEATETFVVTLSGPTNATLAKSQGIGTITSVGGVPSLSIADTVVIEATGASAQLRVTLSTPSNQVVQASYSVVGITALVGSDLLVPVSTLVSFPAGTTVQTITLPIVNDTLDEIDESFSVTLIGASNATLSRPTATGTIIDDDPQPTLTIDDVRVSDSGSTPNAVFTVHLSAPSSRPISVAFQTTSGSAQAGADFQAQAGTLQIPAGATSATISVPILTDALTEGDETFSVNLGNPVNAGIARGVGAGTITDGPVSGPAIKLFVPLARR